MADIHYLPLAETEAVIRLTKHLQMIKRQNMLLEEEAGVSYRNGYRDGVRDATDKVESALCSGLSDLKAHILYSISDLLDPLTHTHAAGAAGPVNAKGDPF